MATTTEQIHAAADRIAERGEKPTLSRVRSELGGGSFSTISEAMQSWREQQEQEHALAEVQVPDAVTERVEQLQAAVWQAAIDEAERRIAAERAALQESQEAAASQVAEAQEAVATLEAEATQMREDLESAQTEIAQQRERADRAEREAQQRTAGEQACQSRLESAQREIQQMREREQRLEKKADNALQEAAELRGQLKGADS